jgi:hypothetical protein
MPRPARSGPPDRWASSTTCPSGRAGDLSALPAAWLHERTKHTWQRLRTEAHGLDWGNHPFPFKLYPDLEALPLPRQLPDSGLPATQVLSGHASAPASALDLAVLARLLFYAAGVTRILHGVLFRAAPCTRPSCTPSAARGVRKLGCSW